MQVVFSTCLFARLWSIKTALDKKRRRSNSGSSSMPLTLQQREMTILREEGMAVGGEGFSSLEAMAVGGYGIPDKSLVLDRTESQESGNGNDKRSRRQPEKKKFDVGDDEEDGDDDDDVDGLENNGPNLQERFIHRQLSV